MTHSMKFIHSTRHKVLYVAMAAICLAGSAVAQQAEVVQASWSDGVLSVTGTAAGDHLSIASMGELIEVNGGLVAIEGGPATTRNTTHILVDAGAGDDRVVLSEWGSALPDSTLHGGDGNDVLIGQQGNDVLSGGRGNDILLSGDGDDAVFGEEGNDLLIVNNGDGSDFLDGGEGQDLVQINGDHDADDDIRISTKDDGVNVRMSDGAVIFLTDSLETGNVYGHGGDDVITASELMLDSRLNLNISGGEGSDVLIAGDGNDVLRGGAGNDTLLGNRGNDVVLGQEGNDLLIVNNGDGSLLVPGDGGADLDFLDGGAGLDTVRVFGSDGDDNIVIERVGPNSGPLVRITSGIYGHELSGMEQLEIHAGDGNDTIRGTTGLAGLINSSMYGEDGRDIIIANDGNDFVDGGADRDRCGSSGGRDRFVNCEIRFRH